jgi:hypothetical protein
MTIIKYHDSSCIDVQFEDGTIKKGVTYYNFKKGEIHNPNITPNNKEIKSDRIGESVIASNGQKVTIIEYHDSGNVDVRFEDGTIIRGVAYTRFRKGYIRNPNKLFSTKKDSRKGESTIAANGQKMTIIEYYNYSNIDIQFEDGTIRKGISYQNFCKGNVQNPNKPKRINKIKEPQKNSTYNTSENKTDYPDFIIEDISTGVKKINHSFQLDEDVLNRIKTLENSKRQYTHSAILNQLLRDGLSKYED